jgi:hypothetical protein
MMLTRRLVCSRPVDPQCPDRYGAIAICRVPTALIVSVAAAVGGGRIRARHDKHFRLCLAGLPTFSHSRQSSHINLPFLFAVARCLPLGLQASEEM